MDPSPSGQVALLIDFENLVRGIAEDNSLDCELLFRLAEEYGRVLVANAYADWRMKDVNQYQTDLYRLGAELVHVFGKGWGSGFKNAVDVKMAVDAITTISVLPHINVFVIVSGDRDFIHVLKALRRHGKTVVGVSPRSSTSDDFAALCDRFVKYEALATTYESPSAAATSASADDDRPDLEAVRRALKSIVGRRPEGIKGAMIKPLLRRELSPSFDESSYGFARLTDLLRHLDDVVNVMAPANGGDVLVTPKSANTEEQLLITSGEFDTQRLMREAGLSFYRYEQDSNRRRSILSLLFTAMSDQQPFLWEDIQRRILTEMTDSNMRLSVTILSRYKAMIFQGRGFEFEPNQDDHPTRERLMRLREDITSPEGLTRLYEGGVAYKILSSIGGKANVSSQDLADILGLANADQQELEYCKQLLTIGETVCSKETLTST